MIPNNILLLATHNRHKVNEIRAILNPGDSFRLLSLEDFPEIGDIVEDGDTLEENALIKARTGFQTTGLPSIGDDTGLEVDALNGAPGVYAARYAGEGCSFDDNIEKLLNELNGIPQNQRTARFRCVMALVTESGEQTVEGAIEGMITEERQGEYGFGYDPIFFIPDEHKTFAQLPPEIKNRISHRSLALENLRKIIRL
ncbi:MAG: XTP/dITP diphosphatase [FCB group bacterium]|nr:XTP/dITP diphosphatase [FCB group bacterium]